MTTQQDSGLRQQATNVQTVAQSTNEGTKKMNKPTVERLTAAYKTHSNLELFETAHHTQTRAAIKHINARVSLVDMMLDKKLNVPAWLSKEYEANASSVPVIVAKVIQDQSPKESVAAKVVKNTTGVACGIFKDLLTGCDVMEWTRDLSKRHMLSKTATPYSALYAASFMANNAINGFNRRLFGAHIAGLITKDEFIEKASLVRHRIPAAAQAIAAASGKASSTTGSELMEVRYKARKHNDESSDVDWDDEELMLQNQLAGLRNKIETGSYDATNDPARAALLIKALQEVVTRRLERDRKEGTSDFAAWANSDEAMPRDTGVIVAAVSDFDHLFSLDIKELYGMESEAIHALWHGRDLAFPLNERMEERLIEKWESSIEWANTPEEKELAKLKLLKRGASLEDGLLARMEMTNKQGEKYMGSLATYVRWVTNHVTRSLWRDIKRLELASAEHAERLAKKEKRAQEEEANASGDVEGIMTRAWTGESSELGYVIKLPFIREIGEDDLPKQAAEIERMRALHGTVIEEIDNILPTLRRMYTEWRELDTAHAPIWSTFANPSMPIESPPIYWNMRGWYMTEGEAEEALFIEIAEMKQKMLDTTAETAAGYLSQMLPDTFSI